MREIKFRAWDKKTKKIRQVVDIVFNEGFMVEPNDNTVKLVYLKGYDCIERKDIMFRRESNFELMQYTGLKDKNGKEIYEGDICEYYDVSGRDGVCIVESGKAAFKANWIGGTISRTIFLNYIHDLISGEFEVIGNIYENPELLEKKEEN